MPTDKKLQDLANENQRLLAEYKALKAENERLRQLEAEINTLWLVQDECLKMLREDNSPENRELWSKACATLNYFWASYKPYQYPEAPEAIAPKPDLSFTAHEDAVSSGCVNCGNEHKSLNADGYCSSCWTVWKS